MLKIKQIDAVVRNHRWHIDEPLNTFLETLPQKGKEVIKIQYFPVTSSDMGIHSAIVEYCGGDEASIVDEEIPGNTDGVDYDDIVRRDPLVQIC